LANHFNFCIRFSLTGSTDILDNRFSCQDLLQNKLPNFSNEKAERNYKFIHFGRGSSVGGFNSGNCVSLETIEPDLKFWTQHEFMGHTILNLEDEYPQGTGQGNLIEEPQSQVDLIELRHMNFSNFGIDYIASSSQQ
jgi:hypothetical protein